MNDFEFQKANFTSLTTVVTVVSTYLSLLFSISRVMKEFKPIRLEKLFIIHNVLLCISSLLLLLAIGPIIAKTIYDKGLDHAICAKEMAYNPYLNFLYYINYLMKFWELGDTLFLVFRKKNLEFLHVSISFNLGLSPFLYISTYLDAAYGTYVCGKLVFNLFSNGFQSQSTWGFTCSCIIIMPW
jgi:GNS1/SUR4 family